MNNRELLFSVTKKDFRIDTYRGSGNGGQHRNKTDSAARITHIESGAVGQSEDERSQLQNKQMAFKRLTETPTFKTWCKKKAFETMHKAKSEEQIQNEVDEMIERDLKNGNIIIEQMEG